MESKIKTVLGVLKMFGVNTQPVETLLNQFEPKPQPVLQSPEGVGGTPSPAPGGPEAMGEGPFWDGEPENYYLTDKQGRRLTQETFVSVSDFEEGLAVIERQKDKGYKNGYIDPQGKFPFEPVYEMAQIFSGGLGAVQLDKKWGFVDKTGKAAIPFLYEKVQRFDQTEKGLAQVMKDGKWFFIDKSGNFVKDSAAPQCSK